MKPLKTLARETGLEPATSGVTGRILSCSINKMRFGLVIKMPNNINGGKLRIWNA